MFKSLYLYVASALTEYLSSGSHYKYLYDKGFGADLDFCLQLNRRSVVPRFDGYEVKLLLFSSLANSRLAFANRSVNAAW